MLIDLREEFVQCVYQYITGQVISQVPVVKIHSENLQKNGDLSLPTSLKSWQNHNIEKNYNAEVNEVESLLNYIGKDIKDFITESKNWRLQISNIILKIDRLHVFLDRRRTISQSLLNADSNCRWVLANIKNSTTNVICDSFCEQSNDITSLRVRYIRKAIENLYNTSAEGHKVVYITSRSSSKSPDGSHFILCGSVLNAKTGNKETSICDNDFIQIRHNEMTLIAQHKYGVRASMDAKWKEFLAHLGNSAVIFELLQIKPCSPIKVNFACSASGSSKGAAFVLYNCARLESILKTYNDKVEQGLYSALPHIEDVDFSLLTDEDEWTLIFNYILGFPSLISGCVIINEKQCDFRPHNICNFLSSMVRVFSQYYRKIRILTEPRKHLQPVMFARLYLLRALNETLKTCLAIINIKSVSQM